MRFTKEEALAMANSVPEVIAANLSPNVMPWADMERARAVGGVEAEQKRMGDLDPEVEEFDQEITLRDGYRTTIRVFRPKKIPSHGCPLYVHYHGGGFMTGSRFQACAALRRLVARFKVVAVAMSYRLSPEHKFPIPQMDAYNGLKYVAEHAKEFHADPSKGLVIGGTSAGGQITSVCARHWVSEKQSPPLTGCYYNISYLLDQSQVPEEYQEYYNSPSQPEIAEAPVLNTSHLKVIDEYWGPDYKSDWQSADWQSVFASSDAHGDMPPSYFQCNGKDPFRDHSLIYEDVLSKAGVRTKLDVYPGLFHGFETFCPTLPQVKQFEEHQNNGFAFLLGREA